MKRDVFEVSAFRKAVEGLIKKKRLLKEDFEAFKKFLAENPEFGDLIRGAGGVRKARLKSAAKGKSGGFRVCYFDDAAREELYLMWIYAKSEQENLLLAEKKILKELAETFKRR
jgi:mRNA-degrading endonuclease RelE of RelBE toxin-antitoxin system